MHSGEKRHAEVPEKKSLAFLQAVRWLPGEPLTQLWGGETGLSYPSHGFPESLPGHHLQENTSASGSQNEGGAGPDITGINEMTSENDAIVPGKKQQLFWNEWNTRNREVERGEVSRRQAEIIIEWLRNIGRRDLKILEVGCGTGWFCPALSDFGDVTATDISDTVLERASRRWPSVRFVAGDFMTLPFEPESFDIIVTLEVLSHVADQPAFVQKLASLLKPGGSLLLATQNRPVLETRCIVPPAAEGQIRKWVDRHELRALIAPHFFISSLVSVTPTSNRFPWRLLTASKTNAVLSPLFGSRLRDWLEARDWGWTLMLRGHKNGVQKNL
jgi:2-polyprenyl-3-methyl-5-hydroxy-6-metoxy-1,4-benzoquinol methylase